MILQGLESLIGKTIDGYEHYEITNEDSSYTFDYDVFFIGDDIAIRGAVQEHYAYCWFYNVMGLTGNLPKGGMLEYVTEIFPQELKELIIKHLPNED